MWTDEDIWDVLKMVGWITFILAGFGLAINIVLISVGGEVNRNRIVTSRA